MHLPLDVEKLVTAWQLLRSVAPVSPIESESDYEQAAALLNRLLDIVLDDASHPLYPLVLVVGDLLEAYEINCEPMA